MFVTYEDYQLPVLELVESLGNSAQKGQICQEFESRHGSQIPEDQCKLGCSGSPLWQQIIGWAGYHLTKKGFFHRSGGIWTLTQAGQEWLNAHRSEPWGTRKAHLAAVAEGASVKPGKKTKVPAPRLTYEELVVIKGYMPEDEFFQRFGRDWELAQAERARQLVTPLTDGQLASLVRNKIRPIQDIVLNKKPALSNDELCRLVEFCYWLDLWSEACALFDKIDQSSVDEAIYSRAKKIAETCRQKL